MIPPVTDGDGLADRVWFDRHPHRRFRARPTAGGVWLIRKRGEVFLRTFAPGPVPGADTDAVLAPAWFAAVWPDLLAIKTQKKARQSGVRRVGGAQP